jgi:hypothetical protein
MPCYRCGTRQVDPDRGESPWKRGVVADSQVLICPGCQSSFDWMSALDRCPVCASAHLVRRLGEIECRDCGFVRPPGGGPGVGGLVADAGPGTGGVGSGAGGAGSAAATGGGDGSSEDGAAPGLAEEVERALERVLGRTRGTARIG